MTPLHYACANGHTAIVSLLLDHGADVEAKNEVSPVRIMNCRSLSSRCCQDENGPLHFACDTSCSTIVSLLLKKGAAVDDKNEVGTRTVDHFEGPP